MLFDNGKDSCWSVYYCLDVSNSGNIVAATC